MLIFGWACSDVGRKRKENQDSYLIAHDVRLFAVADGMGGHNGGEVASDLAVRAIDEHVRAHKSVLVGGAEPERARDPASDPAARLLAESLHVANRRIHDTGMATPDLRGMGTTTTTLMFTGGRAIVAHVGDSRAYLVRGQRILQLSEDHSLVHQQLRAGLITADQARNSPWKNIIVRSVGVEASVEVDVVSVEVVSGDTYLICSDGLSNLVTDEEIAIAVQDNFLHRVPEVLVDLANERGGADNITVVVAYAVDEHEMAVAPAASTR